MSPRSKQLDILEKGQAPDGEVLMLNPSAKNTSRMKRVKGLTDWSRQKTADKEDANNPRSSSSAVNRKQSNHNATSSTTNPIAPSEIDTNQQILQHLEDLYIQEESDACYIFGFVNDCRHRSHIMLDDDDITPTLQETFINILSKKSVRYCQERIMVILRVMRTIRRNK